MPKLLPSNQTLQDQAFAQLLDRAAIDDNTVIRPDPMTCHASLLPHIAAGYGSSIRGMNEPESRKYLATIERTKRHQGTVAAVVATLDVVWDDATLVEWFENPEELEVGEFGVDVVVEPDPDLVYDDRKFRLSRRLIDQAKNVRSHLKSFHVRLPPIVATVEVSTLKSPVMLHPYMDINELIQSGIETKAGWMYEPTVRTTIDEALNLDSIHIKGGYQWQVEV